MAEDITLNEIGMQALICAKKAFQDYVFSEHGVDPAHFDIRFTAYVVGSNFATRLSRIEIEDELKGDKNG